MIGSDLVFAKTGSLILTLVINIIMALDVTDALELLYYACACAL